ncbi:MAG: SH3 domain-containing protein [Dehalococcoidia bacterium]
MKLPFRRTPMDEDALEEPVQVQPQRALPRHEQRLMFEGNTHWGRGLAIILGMVGTVIVFLVILTLLPRPGNGNPFDSITNSLGSSSGIATPVVGIAPPGGAAQAGTLPTVAPKPAAAGPGGTGTPGAKWLAVARSGVPNVRSAPSTNNNPIGNLSPSRQVEVIGRSPDNAWLQIVWDNNQKAWVARDLMTIVSGDAAQIPVVKSP